MIAIGVDGCRGGWVAVALRDGKFAAAAVAPLLVEVVGRLAVDPDVIAVDIPIGLPAIDESEVRRCDSEARRMLGKRGSSVFAAPPFEVLEAEPYAVANALAKERWGRGISTQAYNLRDKILEAAEWAPDAGEVFEVHPELSFVAMNGGESLRSKRSFGGAAARAALLKANGIDLSGVSDEVATVTSDDVLDAAAAAWSATRIARNNHETVPADASPDEPTITY